MEKKTNVLNEKIKAKIIEVLMSGNVSFSDMLDKVELRDHGQLNYHLNVLIDEGLIKKDEGVYSVTDYGKMMGVYIKQFQLKEMYPIPVVCNIVINSAGEILMLKRAKHPEKGKWGFPGGKVVFGETISECAERELFEETGLKIKALRVMGNFPVIVHENGKVSFHVILIPVLMEPFEGDEKIRLVDEHSEYKFIHPSNPKKYKFVSVNGEILKEIENPGFAFKEFVHKV